MTTLLNFAILIFLGNKTRQLSVTSGHFGLFMPQVCRLSRYFRNHPSFLGRFSTDFYLSFIYAKFNATRLLSPGDNVLQSNFQVTAAYLNIFAKREIGITFSANREINSIASGKIFPCRGFLFGG